MCRDDCPDGVMIVKCIVAYDGSPYCGWQVQSGSETIQETIEKALKKMHKRDITIVGSGRTDTGVHALGQVFHFETELNLTPFHWCAAINRLLPKSIRIQDAMVMPDGFHARFDVVSKRYDYYVTSDADNPFIQNYMGKERRQLDIKAMQECAAVFVGTHDFTSFTSNKIHADKSRVRTITRVDVETMDKGLRMIFEGDGFLRYQVRMMAQTLIEAGLHHEDKGSILKMLEAKDKHACHYKAAACGLYLVRVNYEED